MSKKYKITSLLINYTWYTTKILSQPTDDNTKLKQINFYTKVRFNYSVPILIIL